MTCQNSNIENKGRPQWSSFFDLLILTGSSRLFHNRVYQHVITGALFSLVNSRADFVLVKQMDSIVINGHDDAKGFAIFAHYPPDSLIGHLHEFHLLRRKPFDARRKKLTLLLHFSFRRCQNHFLAQLILFQPCHLTNLH